MEPVETIALKPTCSSWPQSRIAVSNAPLWLQKGYIAGPRRILGEGSVQTNRRIHDSQAVGTNQTHGAATQLLLNLPFEFDAFCSPFAKSRGDNDCRLHAGVHTLSNDARNRASGRSYDGQIHLFRNVADRRVCLASTNLGMA